MKHLKTFAALCCMAALFAACEKHNVEPTAGDANDHEYVDLGLSVKWATCNIGATTPEGYGHYYAWGETTPKDYYDWSTYKLATATWDATYESWQLETLTKYCTSGEYGTVDNKTALDLEDDAATVLWGGKWRIPTDDEWKELIDNCTWTWTTHNGVNGYEVKSKTNENSIFIPAAGYCDGFDSYNAGYYGEYWSSSLTADDTKDALHVLFYSDGVDRYNLIRYYGQSVRPVIKID